MIEKPAVTTYPIHDLIRTRWSPRAFTPTSLSVEELGSIMEAARWAASASNKQPWRFIVARRDETEAFELMLKPLVEGNAMWAKDAGALILAVEVLREEDGSENAYSSHDVGQANAIITLQAEALGLRCHQMAGFDKDAARELLHIPERYAPLTYIAVGHQAPAEKLVDFLEERELAPRSRKPLEEIVFHGTFGE